MISLTRRQALVASAATLATGLSYPVSAQAPISLAKLSFVADLILPKDALSPAASEVGAVQELQDMIKGQLNLEKLMSFGLAWLDHMAQGSFENLPSAQQIQILEIAQTSDYDQVPGRFFYVFRTLLIEAYYSQPQALAGLPLNSAPQPNGYPPPWD
ncbi:hypothetical protein NBRC116601_11420 [Cognatishimia sp. WU-CL00825]|uniref:gluconate 2-dehydrogenase subunit 3 family protein n=1 Tax=Cognatishimia sp. WU-CL00825 TaxID=3127658 RepID=UPI0031084294